MKNPDLLGAVADEWFNPVDKFANWPTERLGSHLWSAQQRIRASIKKNRKTAVPSAHDQGKSYIAASAACEWIDTHKPGEAFVVTTAPGTAQVEAILWREIERMHRKAGLPGRILFGRYPEWKLGRQLVGYGRKPADYDDNAFQGIHELFLLVIIDEADGIPEKLWVAVEALLTNANARALAIGNPDNPTSEFRKVCLPGSGWNVIPLDGLRSPNFTEPGVKAVSNLKDSDGHVITGDLHRFMVDHHIPFATEDVPYELQENLLTPLWPAERMPKWNVSRLDDGTWSSSPLWESRVRGRFPTSGTDNLIPLAWIEAANQRWHDAMQLPVEKLIGGRVYGVDVARTGDDDTCCSERIGTVVLYVDRVGWGKDTMTIANRMHERLLLKPGKAGVDVVGVGGGPVDRLHELGHEEVFGFNGQNKTEMRTADNEFSFPNVRSAAWWNLRELLDPSNPATCLALPPDEFLTADLTSPTYRIAPGAKIVVEEKKETKKRLGRSPDTGDSVVINLWYLTREGFEPFTVEAATSSELTVAYDPKDNQFCEGDSAFDTVLASWEELLNS